MSAPSQRERVLAMLRRAGPRGITSIDVTLPAVIDGGPPITRLASRIDELRRAGHRIERAGRRSRCTVYRLAAPAPAPAESPAPAAPPVLFEPPAPPPRSAIDGEWEPGS